MVALVFGFIVLVMIGAGVLISRLAEIAKTDKGKKTWIWGDSHTDCAYCGAAPLAGRHCQVCAVFIGGGCF